MIDNTQRFLAIAKKAAEYSRGDISKYLKRNAPSLYIALIRLDIGLEWEDKEDQGHLNQRVVFTDENFWDRVP